MKKKLLFGLCLVLCAALLSGCGLLTVSQLTDMLPDDGTASRAAATPADPAVPAAGGDTVTISREDYERYRQFDELLDIMDIVEENYYEDVDPQDMLYGAAAGMLDAIGDPYTFYYTPEEYAQLWEDDEGEYAGIGVQISASYATQVCTITRVFPGGPAEAAGVQRGDVLYMVGEDLYVTADTLDDAVSVMRGTPGTDVDVTFLRDGEP